ncbi:MAG: aminoacyl-tRNA hydrolase [Patescibacteria group bacterium]|nr:aminoacyl-tRNA hydrolase [Patescibacteria group bacterium]MDD5490234.1 aminoacyl-tRNA hydrolase [Patescibacteria group bacterium]
MKLIVGLGNPGKEYEKTRHNIGWRVLDALDLDWKENKKLKGEIAKEKNTIYLKPQTFMNLSGEAVATTKQFYKIKPENIIVVYDDLDLPFGTMRIKKSGSSGGHKGLESVLKKIKSPDFTRVRLGTANNQRAKIPAEKFVLQRFSPSEEKKLKNVIKTAKEALLTILTESAERAMNKYN